MGLNAENHCAAAVLSVFERLKFSSKKVLTKWGYPAIIINVVASDASHSQQHKRSLKTIQRKVILYKKEDTGAPKGATIVSTVRF